MTPYDPYTGRRTWSAADKLHDRQQYLRRLEREVSEAEQAAARTLEDRLRLPLIFIVSCVTAMAIGFLPVVTGSVTDESAAGGLIFIGIVGAFVILFAIGCLLEAIGDHRGAAARGLSYAVGQRDEQVREVARLQQDADVEAEREVEEKRRIREQPSPEQLLRLVVAGTSRDLPLVESDAALWARVAANSDDNDAWDELDARNQWGRDLRKKIETARGHIRTTGTPDVSDAAPQHAGFAG